MPKLPKAYDAKSVESKWYQFWEKEDFFHADPESSKPKYCIVIPPPNVTGKLHMGHALCNTLQDILIRWRRMSGDEVLWVPGTDHAGISTQTVVERHLMETQGKRRADFTREAFLDHVMNWKEEYEEAIIGQLKRLGCSCDWERKRFTMDEGNNRAVRTIFKHLFDQGLIYRGDYLVNWDPVTQTALGDDEVEYEERTSKLWYFKYPYKDGSGHAVIATTRPETMLGDTAVAVSPKDERYAKYVGKSVVLPLMDREIPVIADRYVDPEFGTGMVKITPAHDPNDFQMGLNHDLPMINIMTSTGHINENGGEFAGLTMQEAREKVVEKMEALGLVEKIEPHTLRVGLSYRSKAVIEPYLSKQWFVKMDGFKPRLEEAVKDEKVRLIPKSFENTYFHWINNLRDWCISRQLWWGHQIPIWYDKNDPEVMICYDGEGLPPEVEQDPERWVRDPDVLDTWFSSALFPFAALGWPEKTAELEHFYPNSVLVTGFDILFFWVARMILMGEHIMGDVPFPETYLHGLVYGKSYWREEKGGGIRYCTHDERVEYDLGKEPPRDVKSKWEKMSKTKGNIIDPLEIIDQYGTDAMRMALTSCASQNRQIDLDRRRFEEFKNFANKIWNGARFVFSNLAGDAEQDFRPLTGEDLSEGLHMELLRLEDRWVLSKLNHTIRSVNDKLSKYLFDQAAMEAYDFFWKEFCAYYVEMSKPFLYLKEGNEELRQNKQKLLAIILVASIRLMHPMVPFITEELFQIAKDLLKCTAVTDVDLYTAQTVSALSEASCMTASYPVPGPDEDPEVEATFALVQEIVYTIRNIRGEMKIPPGIASDVEIVAPASDHDRQMIEANQALLKSLVKVGQLNFSDQIKTEGFHSMGVVQNLKVIIRLPEALLSQEKARLAKEKERLSKAVEKTMQQLSNPNFLDRAPKELVEKQNQALSKAKTELEEVSEKLAKL